ncbi:hypothetical protein PHYBOEH_006534 [Phytophthora boehmeriae]|uniref:Uncharacterized protein n=1 Tax=Phytophthora boehmeriae TaxID=109152 RepID=A0A8T1WFH6_9STRA|nr:hypothetical protein PHYBOEH_006534 [Phytophthora boehmeriae]
METFTTDTPGVHADTLDLPRRKISAIPIFILVLFGLMVFGVITETKLLQFGSTLPNDHEFCSPRGLNASTIKYHSSHQFYTKLKSLAPLPAPVFRQEHIELCNDKRRSKKTYNYCLPISGRKDSPFCINADRTDLLSFKSSICYASVLHMLLVEVYEELQAVGNTPLILFGSLLGAVRNESMIPFTEDADIGFVGELIGKDALQGALRRKGYHIFFMDIYRVCVAPTHPLAGFLYDANLPINTTFAVPYVDLYSVKQQEDGNWDIQELNATNGSILHDSKVQPFSKVNINGMAFDTVREPKFFLQEAYGDDYMTPKPREVQVSG